MKKTYFLATAVAAVAAMMLTSTLAIAADPTNDPRAEIFRVAGCEAEWLRPVIGKDGETILYWQNTDGKGCEPSRKGGLRDDLANIPGLAPEEPVGELAAK